MEPRAHGIPTIEEFLTAPVEQVARVAPTTMILSLGGTRRAAILAGVTPHSDAHVTWMRETMFACLDQLFYHGVRHIVATAIVPANLVEFAAFRARFLSWAEQGMAGPEAMQAYAQFGWQARLIGTAGLPELQPSAERLRMCTRQDAAHRLWWWVASGPDAALHELLLIARRTAAQTQRELVQALYGEDIPPATLFMAFGKPMISAGLLPPLVVGDMQCYWTQRPGHSLDAPTIRRIFYDYAYMRPTGSGTDRSGRYTHVLRQRAAWEVDAVLGVGQRLGPFWYPAPFPDRPLITQEVSG